MELREQSLTAESTRAALWGKALEQDHEGGEDVNF